MTDPEHDQAAAALRDLRRLRELMAPYIVSSKEPYVAALARMPEAERAEAEAILSAVSAEDPDKARERREILVRYASYAELLRRIADDETQRPATRGEADKMLGEIERDRDRLAGLPSDDSAD